MWFPFRHPKVSKFNRNCQKLFTIRLPTITEPTRSRVGWVAAGCPCDTSPSHPRTVSLSPTQQKRVRAKRISIAGIPFFLGRDTSKKQIWRLGSIGAGISVGACLAKITHFPITARGAASVQSVEETSRYPVRVKFGHDRTVQCVKSCEKIVGPIPGSAGVCESVCVCDGRSNLSPLKRVVLKAKASVSRSRIRRSSREGVKRSKRDCGVRCVNW